MSLALVMMIIIVFTIFANLTMSETSKECLICVVIIFSKILMFCISTKYKIFQLISILILNNFELSEFFLRHNLKDKTCLKLLIISSIVLFIPFKEYVPIFSEKSVLNLKPYKTLLFIRSLMQILIFGLIEYYEVFKNLKISNQSKIIQISCQIALISSLIIDSYYGARGYSEFIINKYPPIIIIGAIAILFKLVISGFERNSILINVIWMSFFLIESKFSLELLIQYFSIVRFFKLDNINESLLNYVLISRIFFYLYGFEYNMNKVLRYLTSFKFTWNVDEISTM